MACAQRPTFLQPSPSKHTSASDPFFVWKKHRFSCRRSRGPARFNTSYDVDPVVTQASCEFSAASANDCSLTGFSAVATRTAAPPSWNPATILSFFRHARPGGRSACCCPCGWRSPRAAHLLALSVAVKTRPGARPADELAAVPDAEDRDVVLDQARARGAVVLGDHGSRRSPS